VFSLVGRCDRVRRVRFAMSQLLLVRRRCVDSGRMVSVHVLAVDIDTWTLRYDVPLAVLCIDSD